MNLKFRNSVFVCVFVISACSNENTTTDKYQSTSNKSRNQSAIINTGKTTADGYEMLHVVFEGRPEQETIKKLMGAVMAKYNIEQNYENLNRCGSALLSMKASSAIGITEMQILKHMYQHGDVNQTFPAQAAISAFTLEKNN